MLNPMGPGANMLCPQCGVMHPALPAGEVCPYAAEKKFVAEASFDVERLVTMIKNTVGSKIHERSDIKDKDALVGKLIINMVKFIDSYEEN